MSISGKRTALVIGGGLSGLSAAYRLQQAGFAVTVIERNDRVGGRVKTLRQKPYVIDAGPDALTSGYREYLKLCRELGLENQIVTSSRVLGLVRGGKLIDIDPRRPIAAIFTPALSWRAKLRFLWGILRLRKMMKNVDSFELIESAALDDENDNAQSFGERYFGREVTDYLVDPLMRLTAGSGARQCSRVGVVAGLVSWSAQLVNIKGGLDLLPNQLAERLSVHYATEAIRVAEDAKGGVEVEVRKADGSQEVLRADVAILATTYDVSLRIYSELERQVPTYSQQLRWVRLISVSLAYKRRTRSEAYVVQVPTVEKPDALLIFLQHNKAPDRAPDTSSLITIYTDTLATPSMLAKSDDALIAWARQQIEPLFPELADQFDLASVTRWPVAGYLATPGFWLRTRQLHAAQPEQSHIQLAGDLFGAGSMESAVRWGGRAAQRLIASYHGT